MVLGVTPLSWAQWLARALDLPFTSYAVNGARAADVLREQLPRVRADYDVAVLYAGVNDVRSSDWDAGAYERDLDAVAASLAARASHCAHDSGVTPSTIDPSPTVMLSPSAMSPLRHGAPALLRPASSRRS
jgi:hypothetical protein